MLLVVTEDLLLSVLSLLEELEDLDDVTDVLLERFWAVVEHVLSLLLLEVMLDLVTLFLFMAIINSAASLSSSKSAVKSSATPLKLQLKPQGGAIFLLLDFELPLL